MKRICKICNKEFETKSSKRQICYETHYHKCPICGTNVITKDLQHLNSCCSKECSIKLRDRTTREKFPNMDFMLTEEACNKRRQTNLNKYGVDNPFKSREIQIKARENFKKKYHCVNVFNSPILMKKVRSTMVDKYGVEHPMKSMEIKEKLKVTVKNKYDVECILQSKEVRDKIKLTNFQNLGVINPMQNREIYMKQKRSNSKYIALDGTLLDSSYEVIVYNYFVRLGKIIERNIPLEINYNESTHITFIDFKVDNQLFEVKGKHLLEGLYDIDKYHIPIAYKLKCYVENNVAVITTSDCALLFNALGMPKGIDMDLFNNPNFPYKPNRPKCFYDVKVNNSKSIYDAFNSEDIRYEMILNRLKYGKQFIDANQVLTALNVTKTYKQPSWFSKSFAKYIIQKYCSSDVIVDSFAGWGTRHDAAIELGKSYIGIDLNKELVDWHKENNRNIDYGDANDFKFSEPCSVFICPPYRDTEIYFRNQDIETSECDWLQIVIKNIPNALEYVMVCKTVDSEFKKYIVEEKENKSHFGTNKEYIVKVPNVKL